MRIGLKFFTIPTLSPSQEKYVEGVLTEKLSKQLSLFIAETYKEKVFEKERVNFYEMKHSCDFQVWKTDHLKYELDSLILENILDQDEQVRLIQAVKKLLDSTKI